MFGLKTRERVLHGGAYLTGEERRPWKVLQGQDGQQQEPGGPRPGIGSVCAAPRGRGLAGARAPPLHTPLPPTNLGCAYCPFCHSQASGQACVVGTAPLLWLRVELGPGEVSGENGIQTQAGLTSSRSRQPQVGLQGRRLSITCHPSG